MSKLSIFVSFQSNMIAHLTVRENQQTVQFIPFWDKISDLFRKGCLTFALYFKYRIEKWSLFLKFIKSWITNTKQPSSMIAIGKRIANMILNFYKSMLKVQPIRSKFNVPWIHRLSRFVSMIFSLLEWKLPKQNVINKKSCFLFIL